MHKVAILQARLGSSRFPGKAIAEIEGKPVIAHIIDRLSQASGIDEICVAIPTGADDDRLAELLNNYNVTVCRGSEHDVLSRFIQAAYQTKADLIVRAKANYPFIDHVMADRMVDKLSSEPEVEFCTARNLPAGTAAEVFRLKTLEKLDYLVKHPALRKHVTRYLLENPGPFAASFIDAPAEKSRSEYRLSMNSPEEYELVADIYGKLYQTGSVIDLADVISLLDSDSALADRAKATSVVAA